MKKPAILLMIFSGAALAEIAPESMGVLQKLPETYPPHWIVVQGAYFFHPSDGKFIVLDADSDDPDQRYKGMFN